MKKKSGKVSKERGKERGLRRSVRWFCGADAPLLRQPTRNHTVTELTHNNRNQRYDAIYRKILLLFIAKPIDCVATGLGVISNLHAVFVPNS